MYANGDLVYIIGKSDFRRDWFFTHGIRYFPTDFQDNFISRDKFRYSSNVECRRDGKILKPTTWKIVFPLANSEAQGNYTLRIAIASASYAEVQVNIFLYLPSLLSLNVGILKEHFCYYQVRFNDLTKVEPDFTTNLFGKDNAIVRHGIHGLY